MRHKDIVDFDVAKNTVNLLMGAAKVSIQTITLAKDQRSRFSSTNALPDSNRSIGEAADRDGRCRKTRNQSNR